MQEKMIKFTKWFIWIVGSLVIAVDIYLVTNGVSGDTISEITRSYSWRWQTIPLAYGVLTGHLFWPHFGKVERRSLRNALLACLGGLSLIIGLVDLYDVMPIIPMLVGIPLGRYLWPLADSQGYRIFLWKR